MPTQCLSCGGIYNAAQPDGSRYFHACSPIVSLITVNRLGTVQDVEPGDVLPTDEELARTYVERPDKRDENPTDMAPSRSAITSEGQGVVEV